MLEIEEMMSAAGLSKAEARIYEILIRGGSANVAEIV